MVILQKSPRCIYIDINVVAINADLNNFYMVSFPSYIHIHLKMENYCSHHSNLDPGTCKMPTITVTLLRQGISYQIIWFFLTYWIGK